MFFPGLDKKCDMPGWLPVKTQEPLISCGRCVRSVFYSREPEDVNVPRMAPFFIEPVFPSPVCSAFILWFSTLGKSVRIKSVGLSQTCDEQQQDQFLMRVQ